MVIPRIGLPEGAAQWGALALGVATLVWGARLARFARRHERRAVVILAALAALLSWAYVHAYLRGGPRIIDATSYWLEARALAGGHVSWPVAEPETATLGRFLVRSEDAGGARAAVLFPPGYPMLLALGFVVGAPMLVGPLLAAALVLATFALAKEVVREDASLAEVPLVAAALSVVCAALRYHTADTMSHGLAALCFTVATACVLRARSGEGRAMRWAALAGLFGGWLFATRPASGLAWAATAAVVLLARAGAAGNERADAAGNERAVAAGNEGTAAPVGPDVARVSKLVGAVVVGALPFAIVLLLHQRLVTGHWLASAHAAHYAANDGPPGCFRYGFGDGIGCYGEHADFVRANLPDGFGALAALKTTARRLWMHLVDAANAEPLALLVPAGAALSWARPRVRALAAAVLLQLAAYAPFYFDGNYPGGGARVFADVLPIEHVLVAIAAAGLASRSGRAAALTRGSAAWIAGLALLGFAVRSGFDHAQLRDRDGGAPLFSPRDLAARGIERGLVFVDTDAAFNLGFDPAARAASGVEVVRRKGDALDGLVWTSRGSPPAYVAWFEEPEGGGRGRTVLEPYAPLPRDPAVIEGESLWPPRAQVGAAYALPAFASGTCASGGRALRLFRASPADGEVRVGVPAELARGRWIELMLLVAPTAAAPPETVAEIAITADGAEVARAAILAPSGPGPACVVGARGAVPAGAVRVAVVLAPRWVNGGDPETQPLVALDRVVLGPLAP